MIIIIPLRGWLGNVTNSVRSGEMMILYGETAWSERRAREKALHCAVRSIYVAVVHIHNAGSGRDENVLWWAEQRVGRQASEEMQGNSIERDPGEFAANQKDTQWQSLEIKPGLQTFLQGFTDQGELILSISYFESLFLI